jgi:hypothetical protein
MRNPLALGVVVAAMLALPAAAQAHHLDQDSSTVVCVLTDNVPTIHVVANYKDFSPWDQPVYWSASVDKQTVGGGSLTWVGADYSHRVSFVVAPGNHDLVYQASWNAGDNGGYLSRRGLACPVPAPPQPTPTPTPVPTPSAPVPTPAPPPPPTTVVICNGETMPAGTTTCPAPPPACHKPCKSTARPRTRPCRCPRIRLIRPDTSTPSGRHGTHRFGGRVVGGHARIVSTTVTAQAVGRGRAPCRGSSTASMRHHGSGIMISLYNLDFFRHCLAWGDYRLTFRFRVRCLDSRGKKVCTRVCTRHLRFFNPDPFHPPTAAVARSSWSAKRITI